MRARDRMERLVRGWNDSELAAGAATVIDFNCAPGVEGEDVGSRFDVLAQLTELGGQDGEAEVAATARAHAAYLGAVLGEQSELDEYVRATQGCPAVGWTPSYVESAGAAARRALVAVGVTWDGQTGKALDSLSPPVANAEAGEVIRGYAKEYESTVRELAGTAAEFELAVETVDLDAYWAYWLDGEGRRARLRINERTASFTELDAYRFALHEVLGHALQYASLTQAAETHDVPWPRHLAIHCPQQVLFEGLAQVLPLAVRPDDPLVSARTRLDHYTQLVNAELHVMVSAGVSARRCRAHAAARVPWWVDAEVEAILRDRTLDPQLRSYLWAYPAGIDWFLAVHDAGGSLLSEVLHAGYQRPLVPRDLEQLWPAGPRIGGNA